ncbi:MAG: ECF transporter S component [Ruminococcus sp.]|nr:ECF transporter S component [Ruminococcus sp.]
MNSLMKKAVLIALSAVLVILGAVMLGGKHYTLVSVLIAAVSCIGFAYAFERRELTSRYAVLVAVMTALSIAGRFIFAPVPAFKPVTALVILSGVYLSAEGGFLTGALTALISNMYFGHGAWTPFQMLAWGLIGLTAGVLSNQLKKNRPLLLLFGAIAGAMYSFVMDIWTVVWYSGSPETGLYKAAILSAIPFTIIYAVSNVVFLFLFAKSFGRKLSRAVTLIER